MLAKKFRLPIQLFAGKKSLPAHAYRQAGGRQGKLIKTSCFLLKTYPVSAGSAHSRFGVTVSAKTAKRAVERNRLKRLIYNFVRSQRDIPLGDYWLTVLAPAVRLSKTEFIGELSKLLNW